MATGALRLLLPRRSFDVASGLGFRTATQEGLDAGSKYADLDLVEQVLRDLRVTHVREGLVLPEYHPSAYERQATAFHRLHDRLGVRVLGILGRPDNSSGTVIEYADRVRAEYLEVVDAVENGNEWNGRRGPGDLPLVTEPWSGVVYKQWAWQLRVRAREMAGNFRADPDLAPIRLVAPSIAGGPGRAKYDDLGDVSAFQDVGNYHYYPGGDPHPDTTVTSLVPGIHASMDVSYAAPSSKPVWCTESGMHDARNADPARLGYHPPDVIATYLPRLVLEHFWHGEERLYLFELLDDHDDPELVEVEDHWGVVRADGTPKPVFGTLKELTDALHDPGTTAADFVPGRLLVGIEGPPDLRRLLMAKSDGSYLLALWRDVAIWDRARGSRVVVPPAVATVSLAAPMPWSVHVIAGEGTTGNTSLVRLVVAGSVVLVTIG
jgi:hypothetical protein